MSDFAGPSTASVTMWKKVMAEDARLREMIENFPISYLLTLLNFAGHSVDGDLTQLKNRAKNLLQIRCQSINAKIRQLDAFLSRMNADEQCSNADIQTFEPPIFGLNSEHDYLTFWAHPMPLPPPPPPLLRIIAPRTRNLPPAASMELVAPPPMLKFGFYPSEVSVQPSEDARVPDHPDVTMCDLGFYDNLGVLVEPTYIARHNSDRCKQERHTFRFTPEQARDIIRSRTLKNGMRTETPIEVQLRLRSLDVHSEEDDACPPGLTVSVNDHSVPLINADANRPGEEPKRIPSPIDISPYVNMNSNDLNSVHISWNTDLPGNYAVAINLVRRVDARELVQRLKEKGATSPEYTINKIRRMLSDDCDNIEVAPTSHKVSLCCPLSRGLIALPCRATTCDHIQCFDAVFYLFLNERKPTWTCPICDKRARFNSLEVDGYFVSVLGDSFRRGCQDIQLHSDGSWSPIFPTPSMEVTLTADGVIDVTSDSSEVDEDEEEYEDDCEIDDDVDDAEDDKDVELIDLTVDSDEGF